MEPITTSQPLMPPKESDSIGSLAFASFDGQMKKLIDMTKEEKLPLPGLGANVDIKA